MGNILVAKSCGRLCSSVFPAPSKVIGGLSTLNKFTSYRGLHHNVKEAKEAKSGTIDLYGPKTWIHKSESLS